MDMANAYVAIHFALVSYAAYGIKEVEFSGFLQEIIWPVRAKFV